MAEFGKAKSNINLKDIKSFYIIKNVFSFLSKKQKLSIIAYNKELQKMISVNFRYYKKISGKYKACGQNGEGKEYIINKNILIFKGEYLNGKRNGIGKEYNIYNSQLEFEGKYLNGKRNGKGKEYYKGKLKFEGEYINGKKWNGKGYNRDGNIVFELKNGESKIKEYNVKGVLKFEGEYINGERNGKGKEYYDNDILKFEGEYGMGMVII